MTLRSTFGLLLLAILSACNYVPSGPGTSEEPECGDQLVPLHTGNTWSYRDLISGNTNPTDPFILTQVPEYRGFRSTERNGRTTDTGQAFHTDGVGAWRVSQSGVSFGRTRGDTTVIVERWLPRDPTPGTAYGPHDELLYTGIDTVTTPAGRFACCRFELRGSLRAYWWARGIGLVRKRVVGLDGAPVEDWMLTSYSIVTD